jgi:hypothetical protein
MFHDAHAKSSISSTRCRALTPQLVRLLNRLNRQTVLSLYRLKLLLVTCLSRMRQMLIRQTRQLVAHLQRPCLCWHYVANAKLSVLS